MVRSSMNMTTLKVVLAGICLSLSVTVTAQNRSFWSKVKSQNYGFSFRTGPTVLLGDLGGGPGKGRNGPWDINPASTRWMVGTALHLNPSRKLSGALHLNHVLLSADDHYTSELTRQTRNLHVNTRVIELNPMLCWRHVHKTTMEYQTALTMGIGPGFYWFNPTAYYEGKSYSLANLNTEGQNIRAGVNDYRQFGIGIPMFIGYQRIYQRTFAVSFELHMRKLFTDYLDDVSTTYADNPSLASAKGPVAAGLADPNLSGVKKAEGSKRGNPSRNDSFLYFSVTFTKVLEKNRAFFSNLDGRHGF